MRDKYEQLQRALVEQDSELAIARSELRSKRDRTEEADRCSSEGARGSQSSSSDLQEKVSELILEKQTCEKKCQGLEQSLSLLRVRHNELEKLLDDNTSDRNEMQQRHDQQLEALEARLAQSEDQRQLLSEERVRDFQEHELLRRQGFEDLRSELEQELREQRAGLDRRRRELELREAALLEQREAERQPPAAAERRAAERESRRLQEALQEQRRVLQALESELRQEKQMARAPGGPAGSRQAPGGPSPGDLARAARLQDGGEGGPSAQSARQMLRAKHLEHSLRVLARHLPPAAWALAQQELGSAGPLG